MHVNKYLITASQTKDNDLRRRINRALKVLLVVLTIMLGLFSYYYVKITKKPQTKDIQVKVEAEPDSLEFIRNIKGAGKGSPFQAIKGMGTDKEGNLYVADAGKSTVDVFDPKGVYLRSIGKKGEGDAEIARPWSVAVDSKGDIYVADDYNHKIVVYDKKGNYKRHWLVMMPHFVKVIGDKIYLSTYGPFYIFDKNGTQLAKWTKRGRGYGELDNAYGFVKDGGRTFIADSLNNRIVAFNNQGEVEWAFGRPSKEMTDPNVIFNMPFGLAQDENGLLYVTDALDATVYVVSKDKKFVEKFGGESGEGNGEFSFPADIIYLGGRKFAIADTGNKRIQIVKINVSEKMEEAARRTSRKTDTARGKSGSSVFAKIKESLNL